MIYSNRRPLWADLVWKSALMHKCEILEDLHQRLVPEVERGQMGDHLPIYTILPKVLAPLLMNRFDYFSNFYEYKS